MKPYELTYIISSAVSSDDSETVKKELETFVQEKGGLILKSVKTVPQGLAYPIKKNSSGFFVTLEFQSEEKEIKGLKEKLEKEVKILRHFIIIKKPMKVMKERRTRKPLMTEHKARIKTDNTEVYTTKAKKGDTKIEDIDKKLDEILSE